MSLADQGTPFPTDDHAEAGAAARSTGGPAVVVGFDGSNASGDAFCWACGEARRLGGRVVAVFVSSASAMAGLAGALGAPCDEYMVEQAYRECAERLWNELQHLNTEGVEVEFLHARGNTAHELLETAKQVRADLLVVGRSEKARHQVAGSLGRALAGRKDAPVVVIVP